MRSDVALLTLEGGSSPIRNPSTEDEDARLASLILMWKKYPPIDILR